MRYLVQFAVPILVFVAVLYVLTRNRESRTVTRSDTGTFVAILACSAAVAIATAWMMVALWQ